MSARPFVFDRTWSFTVEPETFWTTLQRTDEYPRWWNWLRRFDADGAAAGLRPGAAARCVIQGPLPYSLDLTVTVHEVDPARHLVATIGGDLEGPARLDIAGRDHGCDARLTWELALRTPLLRSLARFARPAMVWAHDRVVDSGVKQFETRALS